MVGFEEMRGELLERIEDLLKRKQYTALRDLLSDLAPADIASLFEMHLHDGQAVLRSSCRPR